MIKSKDRISSYGEVFTSDKEVQAMLGLVEEEAQRIDSRFLEPACCNGNFLADILRRKLAIVEEKYKSSQYDFEIYAFQAVASIYGIDLLEDNVSECRDRLAEIVKDRYQTLYRNISRLPFLECIEFVLSKNILWGDALTLLKPNLDEPIIFTEWSFVNGPNVKRTEYTLNNLLAYQPMHGENLFSDLGDEAFIPKPEKSHPIVHFMEITKDV